MHLYCDEKPSVEDKGIKASKGICLLYAAASCQNKTAYLTSGTVSYIFNN